MKTAKTQKLILLIAGAIMLSSCQQPGELDLLRRDGFNTQYKAENNDVPPVNQEPPALPTPGQPTTPNTGGHYGTCTSFLSQVTAVNTNATNDININGRAGGLTIDEARTVRVQTMAGALTVKSAVTIESIRGVAGTLRINALDVKSIDTTAGSTCVAADTVELITAGAGSLYIKANVVKSVTVRAGTIHVYGATVERINGLAGTLCLHDGAKVLNLGVHAGNVRTNCNPNSGIMGMTLPF